MDNKKILLVNLSKGRTGELNSKLLGMIFVMKFQAAAMSRSSIPEDSRVDFSLYVDEFQNFSTDSFATIMSEARKYHLNLIVANQFTTQLTPEIRDAVFGNMGTIVTFRVGQNDIESLGKYFQPIFDVDDLLRVPNFNTIVRTLIGGVPTQPFSMATLPALGTPNPRLAEALKQLSAAKYGKPKAVVEQDINARMVTKETPRPASGLAPIGTGQGATPQRMPTLGSTTPAWPPQQSGPTMGSNTALRTPTAPMATPVATQAKSTSFLDEWLNKRRTGIPSPSITALDSLPRGNNAPPQVTTGLYPGTAAPLPPTQPGVTKNISSEAIERKEVDKIAAELKNQLNDLELPKVSEPVAQTKPQQPTDELKTLPSKPKSKTEDTLDLQPGQGDTIYIDREGVMHSSETVDKPKS
jgi:hypothetical protein